MYVTIWKNKICHCFCFVAIFKHLVHIFSFKVLFVRWVLTVFDLIDCKDDLRSIYGFIFSFVTEENMVSCALQFFFSNLEYVHVSLLAYVL